MISRDDERLAALQEIAFGATELQRDLIPLTHRVARERGQFGEEIELEEISFWYKCLVHEALSFVDGLCHTMRVVLGRFAAELESDLTAKQLAVVRDSALRQPLRRIVPLTFRALPKLFGAAFELDTGGTNYRAFLALVDARERFTHPKEPKDIHPFAALATINFALEWIFLSWRDLLLACAANFREGVRLVPSLPERRQPFDERRLAGFEKAEREYDAAHASDGFAAKLSAMIFGLMDDTGRALDLANARDEVGDASINFRLRNLVRLLYTEIEGTVFVAASYLFEHRFAEDKPTKALLTGSHEVVRARIVKVLAMAASSRAISTNAA